MPLAPQIKIPATYMRGGTSKGVFFKLEDLPENARVAGADRDQLLLRVMGSPDPYGKQTDGMGGATSSTSKAVIMSRSDQPNHDVNYLFGQVSIDSPFVDWSGNCGNLSSAVGAFAITNGLVDVTRIPENGECVVRIWQENIGKTILNRVPITDGQVQETGLFELDGVTFPAAEIPVEFISPIEPGDAVFPTSNLVDQLDVPGIGSFRVTMINAGIPTIFINATDLGYSGTESQSDINADAKALQRLEQIRARGAVQMGLIDELCQAATRQHTPKLILVAPASDYIASNGKTITANDIDINCRALSMGKLHHAMMGTGAVAIASAAAIQGTLVNAAAGGEVSGSVVFGHPSGKLKVGATVYCNDGEWLVESVVMSRSARVLMEGWVYTSC